MIYIWNWEHFCNANAFMENVKRTRIPNLDILERLQRTFSYAREDGKEFVSIFKKIFPISYFWGNLK